jgi:hypothetical protein
MAAPNDSIAFSDTTNKNGLIQLIEFWTNLGDGAISGNATLLKVMTARVNSAFDRIMPLLMSMTDYLRWDDINNTDLPVGTIDVVSGQSDYTIKTDANALNILNITGVQIHASNNATFFFPLQRMTMDDEWAPFAISPPATTFVGVPRYFLEMGNTLFLFPQPNYSATNGMKIFFERDPSYFLSTDTTKKPGIPRPFHELLALYPAYDWIVTNKPDNTVLVTRIEAQIKRRESELEALIGARAPTHNKITAQPFTFR